MIGIISDIHGNYPALCAVLNQLDIFGCKQIYCLGDVVGYYCMINECIETLRERDVICIKGNHEGYLLGENKCPRSYTVNYCIEYQKSIINETNIKWIRTLKNYYVNDLFSMVHGGWTNYLDEYIDSFSFDEELMKKYEVNFFWSGHTHKQLIQNEGNKTYCNPGSVGQPRDYIWKAGFATFENGKIDLHRVEYDVDEIAYAMQRVGFNEYYYNNLYRGCRIGEKI